MLNIFGNDFKAIPGVVLNLQNLKSLRRLNNPLVQRWSGLETFPHIKVVKTQKQQNLDGTVETLQCQAARTVMSFHIDYWSADSLPSLQCKLLDSYGSKYNYCHNCHTTTSNNDGKHTTVAAINIIIMLYSSLVRHG